MHAARATLVINCEASHYANLPSLLLLPNRSAYSHHSVLRHLQSMFMFYSDRARDHISHQYKIKDKIVLFIPSIVFLGMRQSQIVLH
jgi:hypothetical protein